MSNALQAHAIRKEYPTPGKPLVVLDELSLELADDSSTAVMGPSGCGKSTLLNILGALESPTSGRILIDGQDPYALDEPALARLRNRSVGFVFQDHHLLPQCSVLENVLLPALPDGAAPRLADRAVELLSRVGLADRRDHLPSELSGGERQRAAIARAMIHRPRLLLADEPTGNLDAASAAAVAQLLQDAQRETKAVLVVVTHSAELAGLMQRRFELRDGGLRERK